VCYDCSAIRAAIRAEIRPPGSPQPLEMMLANWKKE